MIHGIIFATVLIGIVGLFVGLFLGVAGIKFAVETNPKEEEVLQQLPGNNCGGCGYAGCAAMAAAIASGNAPVNGCPVGGDEVGAKVAKIMGVDTVDTVRMTAYVRCKGDCEKTKSDYDYSGTKDCSMVQFVPGGGPKSCNYGCVGFGNCVKACQFGAIHVENGVAVVDSELCKACGKCIDACPKKIIEFVPYEAKCKVGCSSKDKGPVVMKICEVGCIGCGICQKNCPNGAITVTDFLASIDYEKCTGCGLCAEKCPKKVIECK